MKRFSLFCIPRIAGLLCTQRAPLRAFLFALGTGLAALLSLQPACAQQGKNEAIYLYRGADRDAQLLEKARAEGSVVVYTSLASKESMPLAKAFEKKTGVKVELWRAVSGNVLQRVLTEGRAKRYTVDVVETNTPEMETLAREKLLAEFYSPYFADLPPAAIGPNRLWISDRLNYYVVAYNTNKIKREDLPKHLEGFTDPKWKGKIGLEATDADWMATVIKKLGVERGTKLFEKLAEQKPDVRKSHILLAEMVGIGEVPVALTVYNTEVESLKRRGGPIDWAPVEPVVAKAVAIAVTKNAPHPHAALLFSEFVLSPEGQELFNAMGRVPTSLKVKTNMSISPFVMLDTATVLDESEKWEKIWDTLFMGSK